MNQPLGDPASLLFVTNISDIFVAERTIVLLGIHVSGIGIHSDVWILSIRSPGQAALDLMDSFLYFLWGQTGRACNLTDALGDVRIYSVYRNRRHRDGRDDDWTRRISRCRRGAEH